MLLLYNFNNFIFQTPVEKLLKKFFTSWGLENSIKKFFDKNGFDAG